MNEKHLNRIGHALKAKYEELGIEEKIKERKAFLENARSEDEIRLVCMIDFFSPLNKWIKANITADDFDIVYSYNGLRFDVIFNLKEKSYIGSNEQTNIRIYSAIKYQVLAHYTEIEHLDKINKVRVAFFYGCKFLKCINNSCTFNNEIVDISTGIRKKKYTYSPIDWTKIQNISYNIIDQIENENFDIYDLTNNIHTINPIKQNTRYHMEKRITKEELIELINKYIGEYNEKPSVTELCTYYMNVYRIEEIEELEEYNLKKISKDLMRKYINDYDLKDSIKPLYNV